MLHRPPYHGFPLGLFIVKTVLNKGLPTKKERKKNGSTSTRNNNKSVSLSLLNTSGVFTAGCLLIPTGFDVAEKKRQKISIFAVEKFKVDLNEIRKLLVEAFSRR